MTHSKMLEETVLWKTYQKKVTLETKRSSWIKEVYEAATKYMMDVRQTFQNYTLHDETHILNVLDAMSGLLGNQISQLTVGEMELLILSACLHDLGMVYTKEEELRCYQDEMACRKFLREYCPELLGCPVDEWPEDTCQWYLRTLHPFRLPEVFQNEVWKELFQKCPLEIVPKHCIIAVCQAHGEKPRELCNNINLDYLSANDTEPLFCALLLRLGDLLDFDDTRAPRILYSYVACNSKSRIEWKKHQASAGFRYPESPSTNDLPYRARCTNPNVEHAIRDFLNWIDEELGNCAKLQRYCRTIWQQKFPFPRAVLRNEIESDGYMSGDFCLTMDQTHVLNLLMGENLYESTDVFIRELLQNAIDAVILRGEMDSEFIPETSRIDLWEWNDKEGNIWFRIDDQGTGMTLGMLQRYFLKVGNSYYNSQELERDLRDHGQTKKYNGISRFGIGFLSSFLCGDYAEVSTLYFDSEKNRREEETIESYQTIHYGLRLQITGLTGYYTLKNQSKHHLTDRQLPAPDYYIANTQYGSERNGYRAKPGTSIVIRLNPGKLGVLNLCEAAKKYLCGARVPVYYNNKRIGQTYKELMQKAHEIEGKKIYELTREMKEQFDYKFPAICGQYPKIVVSVIPLDTEENQILPDFSGILIKYDIRFDILPQWKVKDQTYEIYGGFEISDESVKLLLRSSNKNGVSLDGTEWRHLKKNYDSEKIVALEAEFEKWPICPKTEDIAEIWRPFSERLSPYMVWRNYYDTQHEKEMHCSITECMEPDKMPVLFNNQLIGDVCAYQGIVAGSLTRYADLIANAFVMILLGGKWKPMMDISRSRISNLPLEVLIMINSILGKYQILQNRNHPWRYLSRMKNVALKEWRKVRMSRLGEWMKKNQETVFIKMKQELQKGLNDLNENTEPIHNYNMVIYQYWIAYFQDNYQMTISYEEGQAISFYEKKDSEIENMFDLFPPMMFCKAVSERSRRYICSKDPEMRRCITLDHPFTIWLLDNSPQLNQYYQRQFQQIVNCLCENSAKNIIKKFTNIREQLLSLSDHHGIDMTSFPQLSIDDFWSLE